MKKTLFSLGLVAAVAYSAVIVPSVNAQLGSRDPKQYRCTDAQTLSSRSLNYVVPAGTVVYGSRRSEVVPRDTRITITVYLRSSQKCRGKWVRTTPGQKDTQLYIEDERGRRYVQETAKYTGEDYYSNMTNTQDYQKRVRACTAYQGKKLCTDFR
jgi:hypothetical protein